MADTRPFFESSRCRGETETSDLQDLDETKTLKNSVSNTTALKYVIASLKSCLNLQHLDYICLVVTRSLIFQGCI